MRKIIINGIVAIGILSMFITVQPTNGESWERNPGPRIIELHP